jgi:hypothetical protein
MAALFWNSEVRVLPEPIENIGVWRSVIDDGLRRHGFANVRHTNLEVAGGRDGCWVSVAHFHIADRSFWEVVMGGGDSTEGTKNTVAEVVRIIHGIHTL